MDGKKKKSGIVMCVLMMLFCLAGALLLFFYSIAGYNLVTLLIGYDDIVFLAMSMVCYVAFLLCFIYFFRMLPITINYAKGNGNPLKINKRLKGFGVAMIVTTILEGVSYFSLTYGYQLGIVHGTPSKKYIVELAVHAGVCTAILLIFMIVSLIFIRKMKKENLAKMNAQGSTTPDANEETAGK